MPYSIPGGWTAEMLPALPDDGSRYEIIDGELYVTPSPSSAHQGVAGQLAMALGAYRRVVREIAVLPDLDVAVDPRTVVRPDLIVTKRVQGKFPAAPVDPRAVLLAIEILSPSSLETDRGAKRRLYMRSGVSEYWIVDIVGRVIERWRPGVDLPEVVRERMVWRPAPGLPELVIDMGELFEGT